MKATAVRRPDSTEPAAEVERLRVVPDDGPRGSRSCEAGDGSRAELEVDDQGAEHLVVRDSGDRVLFEYDPASSRCVVHVPRGDLVLRADEGAIELDSDTAVRLRGGETVEVESELLRLSGGTLTSAFKRVRQRIDVLETTAGRIVERAKETYTDVENLAQTRAGRLRYVAERTFHVLGARTLLKAHKDLKLKGKTIHLG